MPVVVGFIPTDVGYKALEAARDAAERRGTDLILVNVVRDDIADDPRHADATELERAEERLRRTTVRHEVRQEHTDEDIAEVLLRVVDEEDAGLLVLGLRRQNDVARHLMGLTAQKLLLTATCEVLVV